MPNSSYLGNQSLRESPLPGLSIRVECAWRNTQGLCLITFSPLSLAPGTNPNSSNTTLLRVLSSIGGATLRKEAGGGNPDLREAAVGGGVKRDLNSLPRNWTLGAWMKTGNPSHHTPWLSPTVKNAFLTEAKTVKTGTKLIIRDITQQQVGEHTEKQFVKTETRQRCTPGEKGCGRPP